MKSTKRELLNDFMVAAVARQSKAEWMLRGHPELIAARTGVGETAMHYLAIEDRADAVRFLIDRGAEVDPCDNFGHTALMHAAGLGHVEVVKVLLEHGADPKRYDGYEYVVHHAARSGNAAVVEMVIRAGADATVKTLVGETVMECVPEKDRGAVRAALREWHGGVEMQGG